MEPAGSFRSTITIYRSKDGRDFPMYALEFEKDIDWEQRRYEIAKDVMQGILFGFTATKEDVENNCNDVAQAAIMLADALIAELKKGGQNG